MAKASKTYTLEKDTIKTVSRYKKYKDLSSDSAALERIILEWNVITTNNIQGLPLNQVIDMVIQKLGSKIQVGEIQEEEKKEEIRKTDMDNAILDGFNNIPD